MQGPANKLLVISPNSIHVYNFIDLVKDYFDEILLITNEINPKYNGNVIVVDFSFFSFSSFFLTPIRIKRAIRKFNPDIIHIHQANSVAWHLLKAKKKLKVPTILTAWGSDILITPKRGKWYFNMVKKNLTQVDFITCDSKFMAEEIRNIAGPDCPEVFIVNFGIEFKKLPVKKEKIIYTNRLHEPLYNIDEIIKVFSTFISKSSNRDWILSIAGAGSQTVKLKELVATLGIATSVKFEGWLDKKQNIEIYSKSKIFVSIPESDATSISLLEAMAYGCIPVVSDLPSNREWIISEHNGIITAKLTADDLEKASQLNEEKVKILNTNLIEREATREVCRNRFIEIYKNFR